MDASGSTVNVTVGDVSVEEDTAEISGRHYNWAQLALGRPRSRLPGRLALSLPWSLSTVVRALRLREATG